MKYLLVLQPSDLQKAGSSRMPLGLPYINGALRAKGFDVDAVNLQYADGDPMEYLKNILRKNKFDVVMCGGITIEYPLIRAVFDAVRAVDPSIIKVGGGGGFSSEPLLFSQMTGVDYAIIGEGEITACELANALNNGLSTENIDGLVIKKNDKHVYTRPRTQIKDVDTIAFPSYEGLSIDKYLDEQKVDGWYHTFGAFSDDPRIMPMLMSRSCPFMCSFCYHPIGRGYRVRNMDLFFEELDEYIEKYKINAVALVDECFSIKPKRVEEFCERIKPYNLAWACQMRVETYSEPLIKKMVDSGCINACFGLENVSQTVLNDMNKKASTEQMQNALEVAYQNRGGIISNILFGAKVETAETIRENLEWVEKNPKYTINDFLLIGLYPGSAYYEYAVKNGFIIDKKKFIEEGCPIVNITTLSDCMFRALAMYCSLKRKEIQNEGKVIKVEKTSDGCEAILKCSHCGHENHYKGISETSYKQGIFRKMECRKCRNFSDYVFDDNVVKKYNTTQWLADIIVGKENNKLKNWFAKNPVKDVALYGWRFGSAEIFVDEINKQGIDVKYVIDENADEYKNEKVAIYDLTHDFEKVDLIIDLWLERCSDTVANIGEKNNVRVVSIEEILT